MLHANLLGVKVWQPAILINTCGAVVLCTLNGNYMFGDNVL